MQECVLLWFFPGSPLDLVLVHLPAQGVAMHAQRAGRLGQAPIGVAKDARDETLLEFIDRILEPDASVDHFFHELFEPVANHGVRGPAALWQSPVQGRRRTGGGTAPGVPSAAAPAAC